MRRVLLELVGRTADELGDVPGEIGSRDDLVIKEAFGALRRVGRHRRCTLLRLAAGLLGDVGELGHRVLSLCTNALRGGLRRTRLALTS